MREQLCELALSMPDGSTLCTPSVTTPPVLRAGVNLSHRPASVDESYPRYPCIPSCFSDDYCPGGLSCDI